MPTWLYKINTKENIKQYIKASPISSHFSSQKICTIKGLIHIYTLISCLSLIKCFYFKVFFYKVLGTLSLPVHILLSHFLNSFIVPHHVDELQFSFSAIDGRSDSFSFLTRYCTNNALVNIFVHIFLCRHTSYP